METDRAGRAHAQKSLIARLDADEELRRREFPICARKIYLAHAADAPLPRRVAEAMHASVETASRSEKLYDQSLAFIARTREALAAFLGAAAEEISLTGPTSNSLSVIANGLTWHAGDEVVCYLDDYPANVYPWLALQRQGVKTILLRPARLGEITPELVRQAITDRTKVVALASANYCSGYRIDVAAIGELCRKHNVLFSVDAIQTLGAFDLEVGATDFVSAGAQKWMLGPSGAGILVVKNIRRDLLWPPLIGGWNIQSPNFIAQPTIQFASGGQKFEPGAYSSAAVAGLGAAVTLLTEIGIEAISERILHLTGLLREEIEASGFDFLSPSTRENRSGILTFRHRKVETETLFAMLIDNDVVVSLRTDRGGNSWLRISPHFYNTASEIHRVAELLKSRVANL